MSELDRYADIADRYDQMIEANSSREKFFKTIFDRFRVRSVLDCSCGTGWDLLLFHSLGCHVVGSDLSDSMLKVSQRVISEHRADIDIKKADFQNLKAMHAESFDAVVCLTNSINEVEVDPIRALESMKEVINPNGIIIFDQGQTDLTMKDPPSYASIINNQNLSRLYTMEYHQDIMKVNIFDFIHDRDSNKFDFSHSQFQICIRLLKDWRSIQDRCHLRAEYYGDWDGTQYDCDRSKRLITVASRTENLL
jgi:ubiquinone/menaquinone biosynthesis C-methylase UbiE